jgi:hypothetical protein
VLPDALQHQEEKGRRASGPRLLQQQPLARRTLRHLNSDLPETF